MSGGGCFSPTNSANGLDSKKKSPNEWRWVLQPHQFHEWTRQQKEKLQRAAEGALAPSAGANAHDQRY